jgi:hypothetical protein
LFISQGVNFDKWLSFLIFMFRKGQVQPLAAPLIFITMGIIVVQGTKTAHRTFDVRMWRDFRYSAASGQEGLLSIRIG